MLTIQEIKEALQDRPLTTVAKHSGVNRTTLSAIRNGHETNLTQNTIKRLSDYLAPRHRSANDQ